MIEFRDVTYNVGPQRRCILNRFSFRASPGEVVAIMGRSGCGKTTLLKLLLGLITPDSGAITIQGQSPSPRGLEAVKIGYLSQIPDNTLFPWLTAEKNWLLAQRFRPPEAVNGAAHVASLITTLDLDGIRRQRANQLSFGQRKRLALAMALSYRPEVVLLDEPNAGLDVDIALKTWQLLYTELRAKERVSVVATHSFDEAFLLADRILFIEPGGPPSEFPVDFEREAHSAAELLALLTENRKLNQLRSQLLKLYGNT